MSYASLAIHQRALRVVVWAFAGSIHAAIYCEYTCVAHADDLESASTIASSIPFFRKMP